MVSAIRNSAVESGRLDQDGAAPHSSTASRTEPGTGSDSMEHSCSQGWSMVHAAARIVSSPAGKLRKAVGCTDNRVPFS